MEILKIGKQAVKVSLNEAEANRYNILNNEALNEEEIREGFSLLLKEIKSKTDFSYNNKKLFTEIFPSKNGGCEIYISCVIAETNKTVYKDKSQEETKKKPSYAVYELDNLYNLLKVIYRLRETKYNDKSSVYYDNEGGKYLLVLENISYKSIKYSFILEYARYIKCNYISYLNEYFKCIAKNNAVKKFSPLT
jgi:negative regulator of genetic competence, sporulation and motility